MGSDFKPWQRKLGVLTLVVACVFAIGWVRSLTIDDAVSVGGPDAYHVWISKSGTFRWGKLTPGLNKPAYEWSSTPRLNDDEDFQWNEATLKWRQSFGGFDFGSGSSVYTPKHHTERWVIPYWSVVFPLALLSAHLLFSKPRAKRTDPACREVRPLIGKAV